MSANLPLVFERYKYGHCLYVDGGISDNFPIQIGDVDENKVLGIMLVEDQTKLEDGAELDTLEYIYDLIFIPVTQSVKLKIGNVSDNCKIIQVPTTNYKFFNFNVPSSAKLDLFSQGYDHMRKILG